MQSFREEANGLGLFNTSTAPCPHKNLTSKQQANKMRPFLSFIQQNQSYLEMAAIGTSLTTALIWKNWELCAVLVWLGWQSFTAGCRRGGTDSREQQRRKSSLSEKLRRVSMCIQPVHRRDSMMKPMSITCSGKRGLLEEEDDVCIQDPNTAYNPLEDEKLLANIDQSNQSVKNVAYRMKRKISMQHSCSVDDVGMPSTVVKSNSIVTKKPVDHLSAKQRQPTRRVQSIGARSNIPVPPPPSLQRARSCPVSAAKVYSPPPQLRRETSNGSMSPRQTSPIIQNKGYSRSPSREAPSR